MKKLLLIGVAILAANCSSPENETALKQNSADAKTEFTCGFDDKAPLSPNNSNDQANNQTNARSAQWDDGRTLYVELYFHVVTKNAVENINYENKIKQEVSKLNRDFSDRNFLDGIIPLYWHNIVSRDTKIRFFWNSNNIKYVKNDFSVYENTDSKDLRNYISPAVDCGSKLNIWLTTFSEIEVGTNSFSYSGFGSLPGTSSSCNVDGVTLNLTNFKERDNNNLLTHEVGHWLNLLHIFHNGGDQVDDTPKQIAPSNVTALFPQYDNIDGRRTRIMTINFMDYSEVTRAFTKGQVARMRQTLLPNGSRRQYVSNESW